jgi:hypothetical protein
VLVEQAAVCGANRSRNFPALQFPAATLAGKPKQNLADFLLASPLRDSGLILERRQDYPRAIDL